MPADCTGIALHVDLMKNGCKELQEILLDLANHGMAVVVLDTRQTESERPLQ